jgi:hypothetical protein
MGITNVLNHVDPSTSSGSSPGAKPSTAPQLHDLPAVDFRPIRFDLDAAKSGDCGIRVDTEVVARKIPCAVTGCSKIFTSAYDNISPSTQFICRHHPHTMQSKTFEDYAIAYPKDAPKSWTTLPKYEFTDSGKKSYPYRFRSKNKLKKNRLTLRLDIKESPSPTLDGLIPLTMGTTLTGEELYCLVPPHAYERLKQVCIEEVSKKPTKRRRALEKKESAIHVGVVQRNDPSDGAPVPVVVGGYDSTCVVFDSGGTPLFDSHGGLLTQPFISSAIGATADPLKVQFANLCERSQIPRVDESHIDFPTWVGNLPRSERPTSDSYKLFFGSACQIKLKREFGTQDSMLVYELPSLGSLPRKELFRLAAERKHLYQTVEKFLRQVTPELFKHTESLGGSADPRNKCRRCGGSWLGQHESWLRCLDCGQHQYVGGRDEFDELEQTVLTKSREGASFGEMSEQSTASKLLDNAGFETREKNGVTVYTLPSRSNGAPNIARLTKEEFVSVLLQNLPKYNRTQNLASRLTVLGQFFLGTSDLYLRDHASLLGVAEETARTWVKKFQKQVEQHRSENRGNLTLSAETKNRFNSLLSNKIPK